MTGQQRDDQVRGYILEHRDAYTRDVITRRLIQAGHDAGAVEAAWSRIEADERGEGGRAAPSARARRTARELGYLILALYGLAAVISLWGMFSLGSFTGTPDGDLLARLWLGLYAVGLIAAALVIRRFLRGASWRHIGVGALAGVLLFVGLSGACLVGLGS